MIFAADQRLERGFVAKANNLKPKLLYLEVEIIIGMSHVWRIQRQDIFGIIPNPAKELGLPTYRVDNPLTCGLQKMSCMKQRRWRWNVSLEFGTFEFVKSFILCRMDEMDLILGDTYFETHTVDVRRKPDRLVMCRDGKNVVLKLIKIPMVGGGKLNLVSIDQMNNEH